MAEDCIALWMFIFAEYFRQYFNHIKQGQDQNQYSSSTPTKTRCFIFINNTTYNIIMPKA